MPDRTRRRAERSDRPSPARRGPPTRLSSLKLPAVSRFRSSQALAAHSDANFGIEGTPAILRIWYPFELEVRNRIRGTHVRASGSGHQCPDSTVRNHAAHFHATF